MKRSGGFLRRFCLLAAGMSAGWFGLAQPGAAQPVPLTIQKIDSQVSISWTLGLGLVQPQRALKLPADGWQDLGAATTATNLTEKVAVTGGFYRLRFLAPVIVLQPQGRTAAPGGQVTLETSATGTLPLAYQWRKGNLDLPGRTLPALTLTNFTSADVGDYSVVVNNRAGSATSVVATVSLGGLVTPPRGIYMGKFAGQTNNAGFAILARTNGTAIVLMNSTPLGGNLFLTNLVVAADGSFNIAPSPGVSLQGAFGIDSIAGTLVSTNGTTNAFSGVRVSDSGLHQADAGFYDGTFSGAISGTVSSILSADGTVFNFLVAPNVGSGGVFGVLDAANKFSGTASVALPGTTIPVELQINGTLNPATHEFTGTFALGTFTLGNFSLRRVAIP